MICPHCGAEISDDSRFCPECGAPLQEELSGAEELAMEREVYSLLATANLYRIRGLWQEAENKCIEVLRRYPNNPTAHSLLGDIYADQGRWEEASEWYELAVELSPASTVDRKKLERVKDILEGREKRAKERMVSWGAVAFAFMTISFAIFLFFRWREEKAYIHFSRPQVLSNAPSPSTPSIPLPQESPPTPPISFTPQEENIWQSILKGNLQGIEGLKVTVDPLYQRAIIDVFSPIPFNSSEIASFLIRTGLPLLQLAAGADRMINHFTLRVIAPLDSSPELAFQGDITRVELSQATTDTFLQLFQNIWLHPSLNQRL